MLAVLGIARKAGNLSASTSELLIGTRRMSLIHWLIPK